MKILQILEESPSLDFTIPLFEFVDDKKNEILIFTTKPSYLNWFDHEPKKLFTNDKSIEFATSVDTLFFGSLLTRVIKYVCRNNRDNLNNLLSKILRKCINYFINNISNPVKYFEIFFDGLPDYVFIDTRNDFDNGKINKSIFKWIDQHSLKTIGVPVSSYTIEGTKWGPVTPFGKLEDNERPVKSFPLNYEYWMASEQRFVVEQLGDTPYKSVGYTGVDDKYIELIKNSENKNISNSFNILLNVRHFGTSRNFGPAAGKYIYEDILNFFITLKNCMEENNTHKFNLIIKPHYYVNFKNFHKILKKVGIKNYKFIRTSIYKSLENIDLVIGMHTSVNLISILYSKPTILFPQILTKKLMEQDLKSKNMYTKLNGYCENENEFTEKFKIFLDQNIRLKYSNEDKNHISKFFESSSIDKIMADLNL